MKIIIKLENNKRCNGCPLLQVPYVHGCKLEYLKTLKFMEDNKILRPIMCIKKHGEEK